MEYQEFVRQTGQAAELVKQRRLKEAVDAIYKLILSDMSDIDKASLCISLAEVYDRMGSTEEALGWFDKGIAYEQPYSRCRVIEKKAEYLATLGMNQDAIAVYEALLKQPYQSESEKERLRRSLQTLLGKSLATWR